MLDGCTPYPDEFAARYVRDGIWRSETIAEAVVAANDLRPDAIAICASRRALTFAELVNEAARIAMLLEHHELRRGDRIVIQLPNSAEFASFFLACADVGVVPIMALPAFRRAELEYLVTFADARAIAIAPEDRGFNYAALARDLRRDCRSLDFIFSSEATDHCIALNECHGDAAPLGTRSGDPFDVALLLLSGGTTGMPKLIPRTHADYLYNARAAAAVCGLDRNSRILLALPIEHNFPLACPGLLGAILTGAPAVMTQSTRPEDLAAVIEAEQITHLPCVPAIAIGLLGLPEARNSKLRSLRVITVGGQRLQQPTARELRHRWPNLKVQQVFGMAEGLLCYTRLDDSANVACTTQGRPLSPLDEIKIVDPFDVEVKQGEIGELLCRGPYTIRGYLNAPDRNREAFTADGFYRTGDLVRMQPAGNLVVEGRVKDLINRGGEKINAEEIEAHLMAHPAITAAALVAMPDAILGERACAFVTLRNTKEFHLEELREFLASRGVARFKWPERLEIVTELPLTNVGKVRKAELRRRIAERIATEEARP
jgi:2,3-dihydroxybenzoate-AMP ligase